MSLKQSKNLPLIDKNFCNCNCYEGLTSGLVWNERLASNFLLRAELETTEAHKYSTISR